MRRETRSPEAGHGRRRGAGVLVAAMLVLLLPAPGTAQQGEPARLHRMLNAHRSEIGCLPLAWHEGAARVAADRSADMHARAYFDHVTPDGDDVFDKLAEDGIAAWGSMAENIALTQAGASSVAELWLESPPHRRNVENCSFTHHGLGERGGYWTQILLAQPKGRRPVSRDAGRATPRP